MGRWLPYEVKTRLRGPSYQPWTIKSYDWVCRLCGDKNGPMDYRRNAVTQVKGHLQDKHGYRFGVRTSKDLMKSTLVMIGPGASVPPDLEMRTIVGFSWTVTKTP